jgi:crossover junction endodeoxyribonuclease RusA
MVKKQAAVNGPCPFCGGRRAKIDTLNHTSGTPGRFRAQCQDCGAATKWHDAEEDAWKAWNKRFVTQSHEPHEMQKTRGEGQGMKTIYHLFVNGLPKPQPRPRVVSNGHVYNPPSADAWKETVKMNFLKGRRPLITGPVHLRVCFFLPKPKNLADTGKGRHIPHVKKPDVDNLLKSTMDAMTEARVWKDDSLVFATSAEKWYAREKTGAQIIIEAGF